MDAAKFAEALEALKPAAADPEWHAEYGRILVKAILERERLRGQIQTLRGLCDALQRQPGYDPAEAYVTVHAIREIIDPPEAG